MRISRIPSAVSLQLHVGNVLDSRQVRMHPASITPGQSKPEGWALAVRMSDDLLSRLRRAPPEVSVELLWFESPRGINYVLLVMQAGDVQLRAFAPLSDAHIAQWVRTFQTAGRLNLAALLDDGNRVVFIEALCTTTPPGGVEPLIVGCARLEDHDRLFDFLDALRHMSTPSTVPPLLGQPAVKELHIVMVGIP